MQTSSCYRWINHWNMIPSHDCSMWFGSILDDHDPMKLAVEPYICQPPGISEDFGRCGKPWTLHPDHGTQGTASSDMSAHIRHMAATVCARSELHPEKKKRFTCSVSFEPAIPNRGLRNGPTHIADTWKVNLGTLKDRFQNHHEPPIWRILRSS